MDGKKKIVINLTDGPIDGETGPSVFVDGLAPALSRVNNSFAASVIAESAGIMMAGIMPGDVEFVIYIDGNDTTKSNLLVRLGRILPEMSKVVIVTVGLIHKVDELEVIPGIEICSRI